MDAYWRAANHLSASQIYLYDKTVCRVLGLCMPS
jgi:phosphoketolase